MPEFSSVGDDVNAETVGTYVTVGMASASGRHFFDLEGALMVWLLRDVWIRILLMFESEGGRVVRNWGKLENVFHEATLYIFSGDKKDSGVET